MTKQLIVTANRRSKSVSSKTQIAPPSATYGALVNDFNSLRATVTETIINAIKILLESLKKKLKVC